MRGLMPMLALAFVAMQMGDLGTRSLLPSESEFNPLAKDMALLVPFKIGGTLFCLWAAAWLYELKPLAGAGALLLGSLIGAVGVGSNIAVLLGMWLAR
jgi:hypothetical protein